MPNMNPRQEVSSFLRSGSLFFLFIQLLGLGTRIGTYFLYNYPPTIHSAPPDFVIYLFLYGFTIRGYGVAGFVFEVINTFLGMLGIWKESVTTLVISLCSLSIAATLHVVNSILAMYVGDIFYPGALLGTNVGILILQILVALFVGKTASQMKRVFFNRFRMHVQNNQQTVFAVPTTAAPLSVPASAPAFAPIPAPRATRSPISMEQAVCQNYNTMNASGSQETAEQYPEPPPKYCEL